MRLPWVVGTLCVVLVAAVFVRAEDKPAGSSDAKPAAAEKKGAGRLTQPWSKISSLSDEQKEKIKAIHAKANDEVKAIHDKEHSDIVALLTDEQKNELKSVEEATASAKKTASAEKKEQAAAAADAAPASEKKDAEKKDADGAK